MCGIAGEYGRAEPAAGRRMLRRMEHRGPDDQGEVRLNGSWLGHRRLSIVDVESGHQPLTTPDDDLWLVGNGEIYNHEDVRSWIGPAEYATRSDNEVALHLLARKGPDALGELEGMFALLAAGADGRFDLHALVAALRELGVERLRLISNNPAKLAGLESQGLTVVERVPLHPTLNPTNALYLRTKVAKMGHLLDV
jgi:asparagine synthase (glutamine-hydrolysing)